MEDDEPFIHPDEIPVYMRCFINKKEFIENYKLFGPSNPIVNEGIDDDECRACEYSHDGICYMLTCNCRPDDPDVPNKDWYNGRCNYTDKDGYKCRVVFNDKTEAWRTPIEEGGFNGCFCVDHYRREIPRPSDRNDFSLFHTLCDIMFFVRDRYPIQYFPTNFDESLQIYQCDEYYDI